ncbi:CAP domain-containing protein [Streptomyces sp. CG1]|uniref:CAP domain-containing protein n=1 Tax=Streptomyces sp. CG1 TaxID=1287523 RepID=UPI0034E28B3F
MGRHRRSAAGRAARSRATGVIRTQRSADGSGDPQNSYAPELPPAQHSYARELPPGQDSYRRQLPPGQDFYAYPRELPPGQDYYTYPRELPPGQDYYTYPRELPPGQGSYARVPAPRQDSYDGGRVPRGIAPYLNPEVYPESTGLQPLAYAHTTAKAHAYLFAAEDEGPAGFGGGPGGSGGGGFTPDGAPSPGRRRRRKGSNPVRGSLIGVSAAFALGTAAVASGVVPGLQNYKLGGGSHTTGADTVQAVDTPSNTAVEQGGTSGSAHGQEGGTGTGQDTTASESPSPSASASQTESASPTPAPSKTATGKPTPSGKAQSTASRTASTTPKGSSAPMAVPTANAAEAEVLGLVNQERAKIGCTPLTASPALTELAESFSGDMATRGFFDHTDPDGKSPWDRAAAAGITNLGGENIARGQTDAAAVMQAWMNSPGHKANILNCDFKTLGIGVHFGPGGPWWTQDFGY